MTNIVDDSTDASPVKKQSTSEFAEAEDILVPSDGHPGVGVGASPPGDAAAPDNHVGHHIAFDEDPPAALTEIHHSPLIPPSPSEIELAAKLGISADIISDYGSVPGTPTSR